MPTVNLETKGCRGCTMCVDICPADVFDYDEATAMATVARTQDCMGCLSCHYICPSQCVEVTDVELQRPYYRIEQNVQFVKRFLQQQYTTRDLTEQDWEEAHKDVAIHIMSLAKAITEMLGRGEKALGRKSGVVAAAHMPEMYEAHDLDGLLSRMQARFRHCFDFDYKTDGEAIEFTFNPCGLCHVVETGGDKVGESVVCRLFHEYWAGLIGAFSGIRYQCEVPQAGKTCLMKLSPQ